MDATHNGPLVAVDIGNTRLKLGLFDSAQAADSSAGLPRPAKVLEVLVDQLDSIAPWLAPLQASDVAWYIGSVQRRFTTELLDWLRHYGGDAPRTLLCSGDLPLVVDLPRPDMVGVDRLLAAVGANLLRPTNREALVVDLGTAVTVDLVGADGHFRGGAILPGVAMSARAMHEFTDLLPLIEMSELSTPPPPLGQDTSAAMRSGLFWSVVGGVRELISRMATQPDPQVFLTGGAAPTVAGLLSADALHVPHLTLGGIAVTASRMSRVA